MTLEYQNECEVGPTSEGALENMIGFEKLGWVREEKLMKKDAEVATKLNLPEGARKFKWFLPHKSKGEEKRQESASTYKNKESFAEMDQKRVLN